MNFKLGSLANESRVCVTVIHWLRSCLLTIASRQARMVRFKLREHLILAEKQEHDFFFNWFFNNRIFPRRKKKNKMKIFFLIIHNSTVSSFLWNCSILTQYIVQIHRRINAQLKRQQRQGQILLCALQIQTTVQQLQSGFRIFPPLLGIFVGGAPPAAHCVGKATFE